VREVRTFVRVEEQRGGEKQREEGSRTERREDGRRGGEKDILLKQNSLSLEHMESK